MITIAASSLIHIICCIFTSFRIILNFKRSKKRRGKQFFLPHYSEMVCFTLTFMGNTVLYKCKYNNFCNRTERTLFVIVLKTFIRLAQIFYSLCAVAAALNFPQRKVYKQLLSMNNKRLGVMKISSCLCIRSGTFVGILLLCTSRQSPIYRHSCSAHLCSTLYGWSVNRHTPVCLPGCLPACLPARLPADLSHKSQLIVNYWRCKQQFVNKHQHRMEGGSSC